MTKEIKEINKVKQTKNYSSRYSIFDRIKSILIRKNKFPTIGIMERDINLNNLDRDLCLVCLSIGYINKDIGADFNIHEECFAEHSFYLSKIVKHYRNTKDVWNKNKDNAENVISFRRKYNHYKNMKAKDNGIV